MNILLGEFGNYPVWIILGLIVGAALLQLAYRSIAFPDRELSLEDVPVPVQHMIQNMIPNWEISQIRVSYRAKEEPRKFFIRGERDGLPGEIEIETRSKTVEIREVEIKYDLEPGSRKWVHGSSLAEVDIPEKVRQKLSARLDQFGIPLTKITRAGQGRLGGEEGYTIMGLAGKWKFEAKQLSSGKIREIELEIE
jgi:hypothetical protein